MSDLSRIAHAWRRDRRTCTAVIETPEGRRSKLEYDPETGAFRVEFFLPEGLQFPLDFGFIPSTLGEDGDPLDVLILMDSPGDVGCLVDIRIVGVIEADQRKNGPRLRNDRYLGVAVESFRYRDIRDIRDIEAVRLLHIETFFTVYNAARGKEFRVLRTSRARRAGALLERGIAAFEQRGRAEST